MSLLLEENKELPVLTWDEVNFELVSISRESKDEYLNKGIDDFMRKLSSMCQDIKNTKNKTFVKEKINNISKWFDLCEINIKNELVTKKGLIESKISLSPIQREMCKKEIIFLVKVRDIIKEKRPRIIRLSQMI
jgi:hypothetical protein